MTPAETADELRARLALGRELTDETLERLEHAPSGFAAWVIRSAVQELRQSRPAIDGMLARLTAAEADADRLADALEVWGDPESIEELRLHAAALALRDSS